MQIDKDYIKELRFYSMYKDQIRDSLFEKRILIRLASNKISRAFEREIIEPLIPVFDVLAEKLREVIK